MQFESSLYARLRRASRGLLANPECLERMGLQEAECVAMNGGVRQCANCDRVIGRLEPVHDFKNHPVCAECYARLSPGFDRPSASARPFSATAAKPDAISSTSSFFTSAKFWLWTGGVFYCLFTLSAILGGFPEILAAPFLFAGAVSLLPPLWKRVVTKWPKLGEHPVLIRAVTCVGSFMLLSMLMPRQPASTASTYQPPQPIVAAPPPPKSKAERIKGGFSPWDGSHIELTRKIKDAMDDPWSFNHDKTVYWEFPDHLIVTTHFRGKNKFGALVKNWVKAKCDLDGNVIEVIEQGD